MDQEVSANPQGAEDTSLNVNEAAERFRGMLGSDATDEASADTAEMPTTEEVEQPTEDSEPPEPDEIEEQPKGRYTVKVNGQELKVTFDELRKGYQLDADYRQKTGKLAEERKTLEAERAHYAEQLKGFIPLLHAQLQDKFANVNWKELSETDPAKWAVLKEEFFQHNTRLQIAQAEQQRIEQENQAKQKAEMQQYLQSEKAKLIERIPDFGHPEKGKALQSDLKSYLSEVGYTDKEIDQLADSRAALVAYEAMQYRKAQKAKALAAKQAKTVPQVQKPGTATKVNPNQAALSAAHERFGKSGKVDDLAQVLRAMNRPS